MKNSPSLGQKSSQGLNSRTSRSEAHARSGGQPTLGQGQEQAARARNLISGSTVNKQPARHPISQHLRLEVFRRDNFCCCLCGARVENGIGLQIDHKIPISRGGTNDPHNLQTLCQPCNLGKSNKLI